MQSQIVIQRHLLESIEKRLFKGKAIILFGARQTGKSTLIDTLLQRQKQEWLYLNGDDADVRGNADQYHSH